MLPRAVEAKNIWQQPPVVYPSGDIEGEILIEVGPGRGDFLFHLAAQNPDKAVYGVEIKTKRFLKLIDRREKRHLSNIKLVQADARNALPTMFQEGSVSSIYINFPDPWPKQRHAKNRLLNIDFLRLCARLLKKGGSLLVTTDVDWYASETSELCRDVDGLKPASGGVTTVSDDAFPTYFAQKWQKEGRTIYYQKHVKS